MIEKEIIGSKGPVSHVFVRVDEDLPRLNCLGRHHVLKISKGDSFMTGFLQAEFVFDDPYTRKIQLPFHWLTSNLVQYKPSLVG